MKIKITIPPNSKAEKIVRKHMAEKKAFRDAVKTGVIPNLSNTNNPKFDKPLPSTK